MTGPTHRFGCIFLVKVILLSGFPLCFASGQESADPAQETLKILLQGRPVYEPYQRHYDAVVEKARCDEALRDALVKILMKRLEKIFVTGCLGMHFEIEVLNRRQVHPA